MGLIDMIKGLGVILALLLLVFLASCDLSSMVDEPFQTLVPEVRRELDFTTLTDGTNIKKPVDYAHLARPSWAAAPLHTFEGRLELLGEAESGIISYSSGEDNATSATGHLPEFDFEFVQSGDVIIPVERGLVITDHPDWDYIFEPGYAWSEAGDEGWSRASLPFFLVAKGGNSDLAGVLTFLFNNDSVSKVYYQITQEITTFFKADLWGLVNASYTPAAVAGSAEVRSAFEEEMAHWMPTLPVEKLPEQYPGVEIQAFIRDISPADLTSWGLVVNGVHYRGGCITRSGEYPYCDWVRMPSFSTAKTAFVAVALMRLEQQYGPGVADLLVRDYLPETVSSIGDWSKVTFNDVLDMATGNFSSRDFMVDEEGRIFSDFFGVYTYAEKMAAALNWAQGAPPGTAWVYRSSDTFILVAAMQNFLVEKQGPQADIFQYVVDEVYLPLGLGPGFLSAARTSDDDWHGLPLGATGLWWIPNDVAVLGDFLNNSTGKWNGTQLLDPEFTGCLFTEGCQ